MITHSLIKPIKKQTNSKMMPIYIHYLITYIPIIGSLLGGFILSNQLLINKKTMSAKPIYLIFIFSSICSIYTFSITKFSNLNSADLPLIHSILNEKILFVNLSVVSLILLGIASIVGFYFANKNFEKEISVAIVISIIALFSSIFTIRSEYIKSNWYFYSKQIK